jgi:RNA polymerase sigma factor (sigma-70 family)
MLLELSDAIQGCASLPAFLRVRHLEHARKRRAEVSCRSTRGSSPLLSWPARTPAIADSGLVNLGARFATARGGEMPGAVLDTYQGMSAPMQGETERRLRFERLYAENYAQVLGYAVRRIDSPDAVADVFAETFLVAWRRLDHVPQGDGARLWLFAVARRVLANYRRGEQRRMLLADRLRDELAATLTLEPAPANDSTAALRSLGDADRELLALSGWEGLDPGEIATVLGCSRNAARIRLHRARRRLRSALAVAAEGTDPTATHDHAVIRGGTS